MIAKEVSKKYSQLLQTHAMRFSALISILLFALILRLWHLDLWGLWRDEVTVAIQMAGQPYLTVWDDIQTTYVDFLFRQPPTRFWHSDFAFRFPSVIWGIGALIMLYALARKIVPEAALWVVLLAAIAPTHIRYSQEGRYYIGIYFCVTWLIYQCIRFSSNPTWRQALFVSIAGAATAMTKQTSVVVPPVVIPLVVLGAATRINRKIIIKTASAVSLTILLAAPMYYTALSMLRSTSESAYHKVASERLQGITAQLYGETVGQSLFATHPPMLGGSFDWRYLVAIGLVAGGIILLLLRKRWRMMVALSLACLVPVTVLFHSYVERNIPHIRYVFVGVPILHLLAGCGVALIYQGIRKLLFRIAPVQARISNAVAAAVVVLAVTAFVYEPLHWYYVDSPKPSNKQAVEVAAVAASLGNTVRVVYPDGSTKGYGQTKWYLYDYPELQKNILEIRVNNPAATLAHVQQLILIHPDSMLANLEVQDNTPTENTLTGAFQTLLTSGTAVAIPNYDSRKVYFAWNGLVTEPSAAARAEAAVEFAQQIFQNWPAHPLEKATLASAIADLLHQMGDTDAKEIAAQYEDYVLKYSSQPRARAKIYMDRAQWDKAEKELRREIKRNPAYPISYSQLSFVKKEQYKETGNTKFLYEALDAIQQVRTNVDPAAVPAWFADWESNILTLLRKAEKENV